tara:strand:+ start:104 stop:316 length:213 start_codon:yes stop_codon:yes gene_type:complete
MKEPTSEELDESIQSLTNFRDRLRKELIEASEKLRIPNQEITSTLKNHSELKQIESILEKLIKQDAKKIN